MLGIFVQRGGLESGFPELARCLARCDVYLSAVARLGLESSDLRWVRSVYLIVGLKMLNFPPRKQLLYSNHHTSHPIDGFDKRHGNLHRRLDLPPPDGNPLARRQRDCKLQCILDLPSV